MINRLEFLDQPGCFNFGKNRVFSQEEHIEQHGDEDKLKTLICLESLLDICYQALAGMVYKEGAAQECQRFASHTKAHQKELRQLFPLSQESEIAIKSKVYKYLLQLMSPRLFLRAVINLAMSLTAYKMDIYEYFSHTDRRHYELLNNFFEGSVEEMKFLRREMEFYQNVG